MQESQALPDLEKTRNKLELNIYPLVLVIVREGFSVSRRCQCDACELISPLVALSEVRCPDFFSHFSLRVILFKSNKSNTLKSNKSNTLHKKMNKK